MPQTYLGKAFSMTGTAAAVWLDAVTHRDIDSRRLRRDLRNVHFRSRAKIREVSLAEFCCRLCQNQLAQEAVQVPAACMDNNLGSPAYYLALAGIAKARQPSRVVEFGTFLGHGTLLLAMNAPNAQILTIDLPDEVDDLSNLNYVDQAHVRSSRQHVGQCYLGSPYERRIEALKCDSRHLRLRAHIDSADLVLVDGGHDMGCISADTENAFAVARPGTVILWDDYFWLYPDVVEYLERLSERLELVRIADTNLVAHIC